MSDIAQPSVDKRDGFALFTDRSVVAMRVNGELKDLAATVADGDEIEPVGIDSPDGLAILRHSTAHVLAQAVQRIRPQSNLGIGPPITDGFYYDFGVDTPFTPEDLKAISKEMQRIIREGQRFTRRVVSEDEARAEMADEPFKLELIALAGGPGSGADAAEGASAEIGAGELTIYDNVTKDGEVAWKDLCRGPHVPSTRMVGNGWDLTRVAAAYWRGSEKNPQLQRIYGTAWPSKEELRAYQERMAEAERRDHRKLGVEMDLFSFPDEIGSGLAVFHPKGGIIRYEIEENLRRHLLRNGYEVVNSPHITKKDLFMTSGHLQTYADGMFPPMHLDEARDDEGNITRQGQDYYLKPMNCPFHNLIYRARGRSYRELPLRMAEFGTVYRYEKSGTLSGLTRVRGLTQDDAHIYVTQDQVRDELATNLNLVLTLLRDYGLDDFYLELSTNEEGNDKFLGEPEQWSTAIDILREVALESGLELVADPGGAAFYGPKISVQARDAIGRTWQMSTIQLDFNQPERFELEYTGPDGQKHRPVMIHRALLGSVERFFAILLEHYAGDFPLWLAPVQVVGVPVADQYSEYLDGVIAQLRDAGVRADVDHSDDRMQKKIRNHTTAKVPVILIAGEQDRAAGTVSFRFRDGSQENGVPIADAVSRIRSAISSHARVMTSEDLA
ncbi:threonine--tRNA ligase [Microbacterium esteraromaticum]|uniref:Threonine--tRNA ligase n=2 Tax=Microbacterium esteraromaticum TaxID=57043 RepID=A0A7D8AIC5_9MICO|nr:threonine--tRNA ligase [Microbacterium esteraromaticum]QMU98202.1 threonine--tRNA ligase [Microbacterium esteraromaticum]